MECVTQCTTALINEEKTLGLNVNDNKTKVMELLPVLGTQSPFDYSAKTFL